jgi:septation ring formation regulator EzrA
MVTRDDFTVPDDIQVLRMEKELLALENELLRAREHDVVPRDEVERALQRVREEERHKGRDALERLRNKHAADTAERRARFASVPHDRLERLMRAEEDLAELVSRLGPSAPASVVAWEGWDELWRRY